MFMTVNTQYLKQKQALLLYFILGLIHTCGDTRDHTFDSQTSQAVALHFQVRQHSGTVQVNCSRNMHMFTD